MVSNRQLFLRYVAQTSSTSLQFEIEKAEGIFFYDSSGKKYIDLVSGVSVSNLGHGHPVVIRAIKEQSEKYLHTMVYGDFVQSPQVQYAKWITGRLPPELDNIYFVSSGSEAIDGAMKLAKRFTGRAEFRAFENAYHGGTHGALSILGDASARSGYLPLLPGIKHMKYNSEEDLELIDEKVAAVIVEPIQAEAGIVEPAEGFMSRIRERCDQTGTLLIMDEIQTGMGRTGKLFAFEHSGIIPDILCLAKSFGGGMPLGAFIASREVMKELTYDPPLGHITTFGGHPVCCAAALAAQEVVEKERLMEHALMMEKQYRDGLSHSLIREIRGRGLFLAVNIDKRKDLGQFLDLAFKNGLIIDRFLFSDDSFRVAPPLIISKQEVDHSIRMILQSLEALGR